VSSLQVPLILARGGVVNGKPWSAILLTWSRPT